MDKKKVYCRYCGKQIDEDAEFCTYCGKQQNKVCQDPFDIKGKIKQCLEFLLSVLLSILGLLCQPFRRLLNIRLSKKQKNRIRHVGKVALRVFIMIMVIGVVVGGGIMGYLYYNDEYLPKKYENEAYNDIVRKFNIANDSEKLDIARKICCPSYHWEKEYPKIKEGRMTTMLRFEDRSATDGYCGRASDFIITKAKKGNAKAQFFLGVMLLGGDNSYWLPDTTRAVYWFNESAKNGYPKAFGEIGTAYEKGIGVNCNIIKALDYFKKGANLNDPKSQYKLGCMYRDGIYVESGWHWETKSTTEYMYNKDNLIREYWDDRKCTTVYVYREKVTDYDTLVPQDIEKAKILWRKASAQGYSEASLCLQQVYD